MPLALTVMRRPRAWPGFVRIRSSSCDAERSSPSGVAAQAASRPRRCLHMRQSLRENALCALAALAGCADARVAGAVRLRLERLRQRGAPRPSKRSRMGTSVSSCGSRRRTAARSSSARRSRCSRACGVAVALAVYRTVALPCLLASAAARRVARRTDARTGRPPLARALALAGMRRQPDHAARARTRPPRGAARRVPVRRRGAAGLSKAGRSWAGVVLGLAIANKEWALLAAGPVLLALPGPLAPALPGARRRRRRRRARAAGARRPRAASSRPRAPRDRLTGEPIFQPWQCGGSSASTARSCTARFGVAQARLSRRARLDERDQPPADRRSPGCDRARAVAAPARRGALPSARALLALALVMLLRCVLDTWDTVLLPLPFLLRAARVGGARRARRALRCSRCSARARLAELSVAARARLARRAGGVASSPGRCRWLALLAQRCSAPRGLRRDAGRGRRGAQETTVSSLGRPLSTS